MINTVKRTWGGREASCLSGGEEGGKNASPPPSIHTSYPANKTKKEKKYRLNFEVKEN